MVSGSFHSAPAVLFTFPSRYFSTIGHWVVFRLGWWSTLFLCGFHVSADTPDTVLPVSISSKWLSHSPVHLPMWFDYRLRYFDGPYPESIATLGLASSAFARHYSRNLVWFLFLRVLRCFSSPGSPRIPIDSVYVTWFFTMCVPTFGHPRLIGYLLLPVAFRSLSRPSSAPNAKAFSICSSSLGLPCIYISIYSGSRYQYAWIAVFHTCSFWQKLFLPIFYGKTFPISRFSFFPLLCLSCIPH